MTRMGIWNPMEHPKIIPFPSSHPSHFTVSSSQPVAGPLIPCRSWRPWTRSAAVLWTPTVDFSKLCRMRWVGPLVASTRDPFRRPSNQGLLRWEDSPRDSPLGISIESHGHPWRLEDDWGYPHDSGNLQCSDEEILTNKTIIVYYIQ